MSNDPNNPYSAPVESSRGALQFGTRRRLDPTTWTNRFLNCFLDSIAIYFLSIVIGVVIGLTAGEEALIKIEELPRFLIGAIIYLIYYVPLETATGRTFGKWITGTIVIHEDNDKPDFGQIIVRTICRMIPFEVFSFLGGNPQGWHDRFSRTKVVDIGDLRG